MKKLVAAIIIAVFCLTSAAPAAQADAKPMHKRMENKKNFIASLKLTDAQKKDMSNLKLETEKKAIELRAAAATAKVELRHLLMSDTPDQAAIDKKMADVAKTESALRMNKIDAWFRANKMLTPDQQKLWIKALRAGTMEAMERGREGMKRPMGRGMHQHGRPAGANTEAH
jgi:Spy/CpxP family protein refolding chaperone